ncbi:MAG: hypothetical protein U5K51_13160 [Flavobacteriaceae bacterium]|nr:hypothetical protein [Flavobacteriaceae bacterium]
MTQETSDKKQEVYESAKERRREGEKERIVTSEILKGDTVMVVIQLYGYSEQLLLLRKDLRRGRTMTPNLEPAYFIFCPDFQKVLATPIAIGRVKEQPESEAPAGGADKNFMVKAIEKRKSASTSLPAGRQVRRLFGQVYRQLNSQSVK